MNQKALCYAWKSIKNKENIVLYVKNHTIEKKHYLMCDHSSIKIYELDWFLVTRWMMVSSRFTMDMWHI